METFFNILQTVGNIKHKKYPNEPFVITELTEINETNTAIHILIDHIFYKGKNHESAYSKMASLSSFLNNIFYKNKLKEDIIELFSKAQKHYYAFSKLALIYKTKKYHTVVTDDLSLNPLDPKHKQTFILIDQKCKYLFSINDLITIIENAIGNAPDFFAEPLLPSNPYNKQPFTHSTLYNIYFKMKESGRLISVLFHFFFLENFNIHTFCKIHEEYIREKAIKQYINNMPYTTLYPYVRYMLKNDNYAIKFNIHPDFPKEILVSIFRPYLYYYFIINHSITGSNKYFSYNKLLERKLTQFYNFNTLFGRKNVRITRYFGEVIKIEHNFNMKHINFYGVQIQPYYKNEIFYSKPIENISYPESTITNNVERHFNINADLNLNLDLDQETIIQETEDYNDEDEHEYETHNQNQHEDEENETHNQSEDETEDESKDDTDSIS